MVVLTESCWFGASYQPPHVGSTLDVIHLVANGRVGVDTSAAESPLFVKTGRVVSLAVPFRPLVSVETEVSFT